MIFSFAEKSPLKNLRISRVIVISGLLTFMYCIELCLGLRTVYQVFKIWNNPSQGSVLVKWTLCVACLLIAVITTFSVNVLSAIWEQKQLQEKKRERSSIRFTFHIIVGGMLWRYGNLWWAESKQYQRKEALLLTMIKFFFTQTFTIPILIVHISILETFDELVFDFCAVLCISANLILTCTVFAWCSNEVEELKKWNFETVELVPLIFQSDPSVSSEEIPKIADNSVSKQVSKKEKDVSKNKHTDNEKEFEDIIIKVIVLLQSFSFSFGRLLALGILLKLAGIYAVSIMFLQLLLSVIYLKFQAPILVSDSLPKWKQLSRLAFMSYILIFEWHINRDPKTAYDFSSNMKHSIFYYCLATLESVFYLVTWAVTTNFASKSQLSDMAQSQQSRFCRIILIVGSLALVFSLTIHIVLLFWHSRRISSFFCSVRRRYENTKLHLSKYGCGKENNRRPEKKSKHSHIDISSPIAVKKIDGEITHVRCMLEKKNSYRDLREPLDEEIEIYFRKCENKNKKNTERRSNDFRKISIPDDDNEVSHSATVIETVDNLLQNEVSKFQSNSSENCEDEEIPSTDSTADANTVLEMKIKKEIEELSAEMKKSKLTSLSGSISEQWGKVSSASRKFTGAMKGQIQKRKEQFQNFRSFSDSKKSETAATEESISEPSNINKISNSTIHTPEKEATEATEGYFVGDSRCDEDESLQSVHSIVDEKDIKISVETSSSDTFEKDVNESPLPSSDSHHEKGDLECTCYICRTLVGGRFLRRRSSSVPATDRKTIKEEDESEENQTLSRYLSSPNISENLCEKKRYQFMPKDNRSASPPELSKAVFSLRGLSTENRIEHYV